MKIRFLGTGTSQGIPVIGCKCEVCLSTDPKDKRLRSSILITHGNKNYVIDVGPDFRQQMLSADVDRLESVLLTHEHNDHVIGLDDLRPFIFRQKKAMHIYGLPRVLDEIKERFNYAFKDHLYPGAPSFKLIPIRPDEAIDFEELSFMPIRVEHGALPILGYRISDFAYLTDVKTIQNSEKEKLQQLDVLVLDALRPAPHHSHLSLEESLALIAELKPKKAFLIHLSHLMGKHELVEKTLPAGVFISFDGMVLDI